jgi:hypothetical protein
VALMDVADLAGLLRETAEHHGAFEAVAPPHDWWDWYAAYMDARQGGASSDEAVEAAGRYMADVKHVVVSPG